MSTPGGRGRNNQHVVLDPAQHFIRNTADEHALEQGESAGSDHDQIRADAAIGSLQAGTKENIIPDDATLKLNIRTYDEQVREHMLDAVKRICHAECAASNAPRPPEFTTLSKYPLTHNDQRAAEHVMEAFKAEFADDASESKPRAASEDFSVFGRAWQVPYVFWFVGGSDPQAYEEARRQGTLNMLPSNHSPRFAPVLDPTLKVGLRAMLTAASVWLCT